MTEGERVKSVRKERGLTLEKFGEKFGMSKSSISDIENGRRSLTAQTLLSICREFNVREKWLRDGELPMFSEPDPEPLEELLKKRNIPEGDLSVVKSVVKAFLELEQPSRNTVIQFVQSCVEKLNASANVDLEAQVEKLEQQNQELTEKLAVIEKENAELKAMENLRSGKEKAAALYGKQDQTEERPDASALSANESDVG